MSTTRTVRVNADWTPHSAQRAIMESDARMRIVACGRRFGKTTLAARESAQYLGKPDALVWWVAPTYDEASRGFKAVKEALPDRLIAGDPKETWPKAIDVINGARIEFRSTERQNSNRGEGLDLLVLDEADGIRDDAVTEDLRPSLSDTQGDLIAISTPMRRGWFHRYFQRGQTDDYPEMQSWQYPTSANPHIPDSEIEAARRELPERAFQQEYLAEFLDESGGVFTGLDEYLFTLEGPIGDVYPEPPYAHGWDLARHEDWTVGCVLDNEGRLVHFERVQGETWPQIQRRIEAAADEYEGVVAVDASRDNKLVADLEASGLNVEPVKFTTQRKADLIENLAAAIESGELAAPDVQQLRHELEVFEYDVTSAGNVRYHAPEGFHDDCVDSLAMALDAKRTSTKTNIDDVGW